jgi:hypothetical protein
MLYSRVIILICIILLTGPVHAAVFPCSGDSSEGALTCSGCENMGLIFINAAPSNASIIINPNQSTSYTAISSLSLGQDPGTHSFVVSLNGYNDYTGQYQICTKKVTHVTVQLTKISPVIIGKVRTVNTFALQQVTSLPTTTITTVPGITTLVTELATVPVTASSTNPPAQAPQDTLGTLSVTTNPAGAFIFIDGVQRGVSPATIPGIPAGSHTILLKLDGYQDLSTPVTVAAGKTQDYATAMVKNAEAGNDQAAMENTTAGSKKGIAPGFEVLAALTAMGAIIVFRKRI